MGIAYDQSRMRVFRGVECSLVLTNPESLRARNMLKFGILAGVVASL
jgi:hypothetical protein